MIRNWNGAVRWRVVCSVREYSKATTSLSFSPPHPPNLISCISSHSNSTHVLSYSCTLVLYASTLVNFPPIPLYSTSSPIRRHTPRLSPVRMSRSFWLQPQYPLSFSLRQYNAVDIPPFHLLIPPPAHQAFLPPDRHLIQLPNLATSPRLRP